MTYIHHYTTVETVELILESRKIRFNRLDQVDDVRESQTHSGIQCGKYFFVSCWTQIDNESIPQWELYAGQKAGVRISLPNSPFQRKPLSAPAGWAATSAGEILSPLSFSEMWNDTYFVLPQFLAADFGGPVTYVADIEERYARAIAVEASNGVANIRIQRPFDLVRLKSPDWAFQHEYRFALFVLPAIPIPSAGPSSPEFLEAFPSHIISSLYYGIGPAIDYLDVDLSDEALNQMIVTTGPLCSSDAKSRVEDVVQRYAPRARIQESRLTGAIRR